MRDVLLLLLAEFTGSSPVVMAEEGKDVEMKAKSEEPPAPPPPKVNRTRRLFLLLYL